MNVFEAMREIGEKYDSTKGGDPHGMPVEEFWDCRNLDVFRQWAWARRVNPYAVLANALARVTVCTPPHVVLPPLVGGVASLNWFIAHVGNSGDGKGAAEAVSAEALSGGDCRVESPGSGEGLVSLFLRPAPKDSEDRWVLVDDPAVFLTVSEVTVLGALGDRRGTTLPGVLRQLWSGERAGFFNADPDKRRAVPAHKYRMCLSVGVQPGRADVLLKDSDAGTPQRLLWMPSLDPDCPDQRPGEPPPVAWERRPWKFDRWGRFATIQVHPDIVAELDAVRLTRLRTGNGRLDGHGLLLRLKIAAAFALLQGRGDVNLQDWALAGHLMQVSDNTREAMIEQLRLAAGDKSRSSGRLTAEHDLARDEALDAARRARIAEAVRRTLKTIGPMEWMPRNTLRRRVRKDHRPLLTDVIQGLISSGEVEMEAVPEAGGRTDGQRYRLRNQ